MYNFQFQHSSYLQQSSQYEIQNSTAIPTNTSDSNTFPSPVTSASVDSPPKNEDNRNEHSLKIISLSDSSKQIQKQCNTHQFTQQSINNDLSNNSLISPTSPTSFEDDVIQRNMQEILDKKRRRRESHNAVERRRRDNINERINELATLLPDSDAAKSSKGTILRKSVDYIKYLHDKVRIHKQRIQELESLAGIYRVRLNQPTNSHLPLDLSTIQPHINHANYGDV